MKIGISGLSLPEIERGDDLAKLILDAVSDQCGGVLEGDVLMVTSKVVSKAAGLLVEMETVEPSERARAIARKAGTDPRVTQVVLDHSDRILLALPVQELERKGLIHLEDLTEDPEAARAAIAGTPALLLVERNGQIYTDAGLDLSNHPSGVASLPPADPNQAAKELRAAIEAASGVRVAVIVTDTEMCLAGGTMDVARGASGMRVIDHGLGRPDRFGQPKFGGMDNVAQQLAASSALVFGQGSEGIPVAVIRGYAYHPSDDEGIRGGLAEPQEFRSLLSAILKHTVKTIGLRAFLKSLSILKR